MSAPGTIQRPDVAGPESKRGKPWKVIVLNDSHNTFDHVAHVLARYIPGITIDAGYRMADRIHESGRAVVWSGEKEHAELYWEQLQSAGLTMAALTQD